MRLISERLRGLRAVMVGLLPRRFLIGGVYPFLQKFNTWVRDSFNPSLEAIQLFLGALLAKVKLRLSGPCAKAIGLIDDGWSRRIADAISCPDNAHIPRCADAGKLTGSCIVMHNGLRVRALGYYGPGMLNLLLQNRGVHEPQEEKAFHEVLPHMPEGAAMIELGAYWGFYSLWFASSVSRARCFLFEPDPRNLEAGKQNFALNGLKAEFSGEAVGNRFATQLKTARLTNLREIMQQRKLGHVDLLHADIQGAERDMLLEAEDVFLKRQVSYLFISTHSDKLHMECKDFLEARGYRILCSASRSESYSLDGVLVAKLEGAPGPDSLVISKKPLTA